MSLPGSKIVKFLKVIEMCPFTFVNFSELPD